MENYVDKKGNIDWDKVNEINKSRTQQPEEPIQQPEEPKLEPEQKPKKQKA